MLSLTATSRLGGWGAPAERFCCEESFTGQIWSFQSGRFRWWASYNNCLTLGADPRGLYLGVFPLFRVGHPPLLIPWSELSVSQEKVRCAREVQFSLGRDLKIPLRVHRRLAENAVRHRLLLAGGARSPPLTR